MLWFRWKKMLGSYFVLISWSRLKFGPYAAGPRLRLVVVQIIHIPARRNERLYSRPVNLSDIAGFIVCEAARKL